MQPCTEDARRAAPALAVEEVEKSYGSIHSLKGVSLEIVPGEIVALLGPNGAGKTTLASIIAGILRPDGGRVRVDGIDVLASGGLARRKVGLAPQDTGVYPTLRVEENLRFFGELSGLRRRALSQRVGEVAEAFALADLMGRPARTLSGGERRRLHTAMTLMHRPPLLVLDEPTTGVDVESRARLLAIIRSLAEEGRGVCYSTHYLGEVEQLGASAAILDEGRLAAHGTVTSLMAKHGYYAVDLQFDGAPPELRSRAATLRDSTLHVHTDRRPATEVAAILAELGPAVERLKSLELVQPNLESVFAALTGKRSRPAAVSLVSTGDSDE
jgi:ABC-2 type transport system ATP-binding protein